MLLTLRRAPSERFDQRKSVPSGALFVGRPDFVCALAGGGPLSAQDFKLKNRAAFGVGPPEAVRFFLRLFLFRRFSWSSAMLLSAFGGSVFPSSGGFLRGLAWNEGSLRSLSWERSPWNESVKRPFMTMMLKTGVTEMRRIPKVAL